MNEQETIDDIIEEMRFHGQLNIDAEKDKPEFGILTEEGRIAQNYADRLEAAYKREKAAIEADALAAGGIVEAAHRRDRLESAHKREIDVLKQRCAEMNAEAAAKDEVIKRLNDAISEEQRRKMATTENPSAVGNAAELRKPARRNCDRFETAEEAWDAYDEWVESYRAKGEIPPFNEFGWLLAPAPEKEGGAE